jgi:hypothetical protein
MTSRQDFTHLLLTRFNTAVDYAPSAKRLDAEWLDRRLALFKQYCFPTVAAQKGVEFKWLVFFDAQTPVSFRDKIAAFEPLVTPVYIEGQATDDAIRKHVWETGFVSAPYLITTRLDNDDGIGSSHIEHVQRAFQRQSREFITFPVGLQLFREHLYYVYWRDNPFLSLIEKVKSKEELTTIFCVAHHDLGRAGKLTQIRTAPQWLQVMHGTNVANELRGGWPKLAEQSHPDFEVTWPAASVKDSLARRLMFSMSAYGKRMNRFAHKPLVARRARLLEEKNSRP